MILTIESHLDYWLAGESSAILQIEAAQDAEQKLVSSHLDLSPYSHLGRVPAEDNLGERVMLGLSNRITATYRATVEITRPAVDLAQLSAVPVAYLPGDCVAHLMNSRYCPGDQFQSFVLAEFGSLSGGPLVLALRDWIARKIAYVPGSSTPATTALETFVQRKGVCRDFAHMLITLARAAGIPARFASVYAPDVKPQDFHAVADVYLDGAWHLLDATGMARPEDMARIGVGADAAHAAFLTVYGMATLNAQWVNVSRAEASPQT